MYERLKEKYSSIKQNRSVSDPNIDQEILETLEEDVNAVQNSIGYWYLGFNVFEQLLDNSELIIHNFEVILGQKSGNYQNIDLNVPEKKIKTLSNVEDILSLSEIEKVLSQVKNLERIESDRLDNKKQVKALKRTDSKLEELSSRLEALKSEEDKLRKTVKDKKVSRLKGLSEKIMSTSSSSEYYQTAEAVIVMLDSLDADSRGRTRRNFLKATGGAAFGLSSIIRSDEVSSKVDAAVNQVAFSIMGTGAQSPRESYEEMLNKKAIAASVERNNLRISVNNIVIGEGKPSGYPQREISEYFKNQLSKGLGVRSTVSWNRANIPNKEIEGSSKKLKSVLTDVDLREMSRNDEIEKLAVSAYKIADKVGGNEDVTVIINDLNTGKLDPRALIMIFEEKSVVMIDDAGADSLKYLLLHEIGHSLGIPHNKGRDVMSYHPKRLIKGELGIMENAFHEESKRDWEKIKELYRSEHL